MWLCLLTVDGVITRGQLIRQKQDWRSGTRCQLGISEKPERGVSVSPHLVLRVSERAAAQPGKRESLSGGMCMQGCHLVFGSERRAGRDPRCPFPTASGHCSRCQQPIVVLA